LVRRDFIIPKTDESRSRGRENTQRGSFHSAIRKFRGLGLELGLGVELELELELELEQELELELELN